MQTSDQYGAAHVYPLSIHRFPFGILYVISGCFQVFLVSKLHCSTYWPAVMIFKSQSYASRRTLLLRCHSFAVGWEVHDFKCASKTTSIVWVGCPWPPVSPRCTCKHGGPVNMAALCFSKAYFTRSTSTRISFRPHGPAYPSPIWLSMSKLWKSWAETCQVCLRVSLWLGGFGYPSATSSDSG